MQVTFTMFIPVIVLLICFVMRVPVGFSMLAAAAAYLLAVGKNLGLVAYGQSLLQHNDHRRPAVYLYCKYYDLQ